MKKLMILGGSRYVVPVVKKAHELGLFVITCDYLPDNIAHKYSDLYVNVSVVDKEATLAAAQELQIDGIMSFACDAGVLSAAYVAEKMRLPFQGSYEANRILQDKGLFRKFLRDNGFNCPHAKSYTDVKEALADKDYFTWPVIVKPVDSAGSRGVTRVDDVTALLPAAKIALEQSRNGRFIVEDFLTFEGYHSSADDFTVDGEIKFCTYSDQLFDAGADNPYTPALIIWPTGMKQEHQDYLTRETQRLMKLLDMKSGIYNIETCVGADGTPFIMEVSSRGGGCKIAEIQQMSTGIDLIKAEILKAVGEPFPEVKQPMYDGVWCEMVIHSGYGQSGVFKRLNIDTDIQKKYVRVIDVAVKEGDYVEPFTGGNKSLGDIILRFDSREELNDVMSRQKEWMQIIGSGDEVRVNGFLQTKEENS